MKNTSLIILAGGQANRMGKHLSVVSKCALPVYNTSLLLRQIDQAIQAGYQQIVVSTNELLYSQLSKLMAGKEFVCVVSNPEHKFGSLAALYKILENDKNMRVVMSFADIYFLETPFLAVSKYIETNDTYLFASHSFDKRELSRGGVVWKDKQNKVKRIHEPAISNNSTGYRWTGLALFNTSLKSKLKEFLERNPFTPEEDFFSYLIESGESVKVGIVSDFLNVNTPPQLLLASLYQAAIESTNNTTLYKRLSEAAIELRKSFLSLRR